MVLLSEAQALSNIQKLNLQDCFCCLPYSCQHPLQSFWISDFFFYRIQVYYLHKVNVFCYQLNDFNFWWVVCSGQWATQKDSGILLGALATAAYTAVWHCVTFVTSIRSTGVHQSLKLLHLNYLVLNFHILHSFYFNQLASVFNTILVVEMHDEYQSADLVCSFFSWPLFNPHKFSSSVSWPILCEILKLFLQSKHTLSDFCSPSWWPTG